MSSLPEVVRGPVCYRLPLDESSALRLAAVLLAETEQERIEQVQIALAADAPLAVWAMLQAPAPAASAAPLASVAAWLAPRLARFLANSPPAPAQGNGSQRLTLPAEITGPTACGGEQAAGPEDRNRRFLALLFGAADWLVECGSPRPDRETAARALPDWLIGRLEQAGGPSAQAADAERARPTASVAEGPWQELLSRLAAQAVRLAALEADFRDAVEQEKLAALKEFAYGAGHEINNPLANISARAQTLLKDERDPERRQKLAAINSQAFRAHEMIADLMLFAQPPQWQPTDVPLAPLLAELETVWRRQASEQGTALSVRVDDQRLAVWADRGAIAVALRALVANALEAVGHGGTIEIAVMPAPITTGAAVDAATSQPHQGVAIRVRDDGPGIAPAVRPRIFDPFFSGREAGRGLGFGLSKCWRIVTALGGTIEVGGGPAAGATFTLVLPASATR